MATTVSSLHSFPLPGLVLLGARLPSSPSSATSRSPASSRSALAFLVTVFRSCSGGSGRCACSTTQLHSRHLPNPDRQCNLEVCEYFGLEKETFVLLFIFSGKTT